MGPYPELHCFTEQRVLVGERELHWCVQWYAQRVLCVALTSTKFNQLGSLPRYGCTRSVFQRHWNQPDTRHKIWLFKWRKQGQFFSNNFFLFYPYSLISDSTTPRRTPLPSLPLPPLSPLSSHPLPLDPFIEKHSNVTCLQLFPRYWAKYFHFLRSLWFKEGKKRKFGEGISHKILQYWSLSVIRCKHFFTTDFYSVRVTLLFFNLIFCPWHNQDVAEVTAQTDYEAISATHAVVNILIE